MAEGIQVEYDNSAVSVITYLKCLCPFCVTVFFLADDVLYIQTVMRVLFALMRKYTNSGAE
jgi:hypothetical protein